MKNLFVVRKDQKRTIVLELDFLCEEISIDFHAHKSIIPGDCFHEDWTDDVTKATEGLTDVRGFVENIVDAIEEASELYKENSPDGKGPECFWWDATSERFEKRNRVYLRLLKNELRRRGRRCNNWHKGFSFISIEGLCQ